MRRIALFSVLLMIFLRLSAQVDSTAIPSTVPDSIEFNPEMQFTNDDLIIGGDSTNNAILSDTSNIALDTAAQKKKRKNDIETTINYTAEDSMRFEIEGRQLYMYGNTHIDYGNISLESDRTSINWNTRNIKSEYTLDTLGRKKGKPVFGDGKDNYETDDILYNFKTKRAIIKGVITEQNGAIMHGEDVKKNEDNEMFIKNAKYTTCNLADPHFFIKSDKIKVIPGNKVVSGPFNLKFREIATPLWFPFGMFPQPREKASGIVFPSYGQETRRGFYLRNGGYYFGFSEYFDLKLTGNIYSKGSYGLNATTNYKVRYKASGAFSLDYTKNVTDGPIEPSYNESFWVKWNHKPETRGNSSFSASVSAGSSNFNSNNNLAISNPTQSINPRFTSNVSYNQHFRRLPLNMTANLRQSQNVKTGIYTMSLPDFAMNLQRIYPLKKLAKNSKSPLAKLSFSYNFVANNDITNTPSSARSALGFTPINETENKDTLKFNANNLPQILKTAKIYGTHTIPISTSFSLFKYFTVNPSFNYKEVWQVKELDYTYEEAKNGVRVDTTYGFSRASSWTSGASINTRVYGMYYLPGIKGIEAIRHVITPSISFSYNPDFSSSKYGVYSNIQLDSTGNNFKRVSKYAYQSPTGSMSQTLSFSLTNNLEMKVRSKKDTANEFKKVKIFDNLAFNGGYNFAADSFKLSNLNWTARTSFFNKKVNVQFTGTYDPYVYIDNGSASGRRIDRYTWNNGQGIGQLSRLNTAVNFTLKPKKKGKNNNDPNSIDPNQSAFADDGSLINQSKNGTEDQKEYIKQNPDQYVDFNVPWSLKVGYNINRSKSGLADAQIISHGFRISGTLGLTKNTQITFNSNYDMKKQQFGQTSISVTRDLHCWTLNFSWVPFGRNQSFSLIIQPKSSLLQDLKIQKRRSFYDLFSNN